MSEESQAAQEQVNRAVNIQKIYLKDVSVEVPGAPMIFQEQWNPNADVQLATASTDLGNNLYEVVLTVTVTTKLGEKTAFLVEVKQGAVFLLEGFTGQELGPVLGSFCPNVIFPYAREAISDLVGKAGFPQLLLQPVNFDALYAQQVQQQAEQAAH
ncbi:MAG: protein-export chaperone SecB [Gammaproteobacteria bacterium]